MTSSSAPHVVFKWKARNSQNLLKNRPKQKYALTAKAREEYGGRYVIENHDGIGVRHRFTTKEDYELHIYGTSEMEKL